MFMKKKRERLQRLLKEKSENNTTSFKRYKNTSSKEHLEYFF